MSLNVNKVILAGRLTADPELKTTPNQTMVTTFQVAVNKARNKDVTDFIPCVAWAKTAEFIRNYFRKGTAIYVEGSLETRSYTDKNNQKRTAYQVVCDKVNFVESKTETTTEAPATPETYEEIKVDDNLPF